MTRIIIKCICCCFVVASCKSIDLNQIHQTKTTKQVTLGSIGLEKDLLLQREFNNTAIPTYNEPVRVSVMFMPFTKQTYKLFSSAKALQSADFSIAYVDSLPNKPKYIKLQIADKVSILQALNHEDNIDVKNYLGHEEKAHILSSVSVALNKTDLDVLSKADAIFLVESGLKTYALELHQKSGATQVISFNQCVVFAYETSNCCWQVDERHRANIVDLVGNAKACPNKTYRSAKRAKSKIKPLDF